MGDWLFPVPGASRISSGFGARKSPTAGASTFHRGIDIAGPRGSPVIAPTNLRVTYAARAGANGNLVKAVDASGYEYSFAHLDTMSVRPGQVLPMGMQLGTLGSTGRSTGPHLHYGMKDPQGRSIDPTSFLASSSGTGSSLLDKALAALGRGLEAPGKALDNAPGGIGDLYKGFKGVTGIGGEGWFDQFYNWVNQSNFFKRTAIIVLAILLIGVAFLMLNSGTVKKTITAMAKV